MSGFVAGGAITGAIIAACTESCQVSLSYPEDWRLMVTLSKAPYHHFSILLTADLWLAVEIAGAGAGTRLPGSSLTIGVWV